MCTFLGLAIVIIAMLVILAIQYLVLPARYYAAIKNDYPDTSLAFRSWARKARYLVRNSSLHRSQTLLLLKKLLVSEHVPPYVRELVFEFYDKSLKGSRSDAEYAAIVASLITLTIDGQAELHQRNAAKILSEGLVENPRRSDIIQSTFEAFADDLQKAKLPAMAKPYADIVLQLIVS